MDSQQSSCTKTKAASIFKLSCSVLKEKISILKNCSKDIIRDKRNSEVDSTVSLIRQSLHTCSQTLMDLLSLVSPKLNKTLPAALIGNMITSTCTLRVSMLQVALGLLFRERRIIDHLYEYKVCASYDEVRRYKISAASHATSNSKESMFAESGSRSGLIQGISDNFDASLSTQNGMKQTHALATIITQHGGKNESKLAIPRLKKKKNCQVSKLKKLSSKCIQVQRNQQWTRGLGYRRFFL